MSLKILVSITFALVILLSPGCGSPSSFLAKYEKVQPGMTKSEVQAILGYGQMAEINELGTGLKGVKVEEMIWKQGELRIRIQFHDGKAGNRRFGKEGM